jgi:hypothetical protein
MTYTKESFLIEFDNEEKIRNFCEDCDFHSFENKNLNDIYQEIFEKEHSIMCLLDEEIDAKEDINSLTEDLEDLEEENDELEEEEIQDMISFKESELDDAKDQLISIQDLLTEAQNEKDELAEKFIQILMEKN